MKTLYLVRHAKSSWLDVRLDDLDRPLNERGQHDAPMMGQRLRKRKIPLDKMICSPATRAISTAHLLSEEIYYADQSMQIDKDLYFQGKESILRLISQLNDKFAAVMLVGHNPDMTVVLNFLCGYQTDNMPTCAIASIQLQNWASVGRQQGKLMHYDFPKKQP